jgi:hypothetical protein
MVMRNCQSGQRRCYRACRGDVEAYWDQPPCPACDAVGFIVLVESYNLALRWVCRLCGHEQVEAPATLGAESDPDV